MKRLLATTVLTLLAGAALPLNDAYACSCVHEPGSDAYPVEGAVFYGEITGREVDGGTLTYFVDVERVYAGHVGAKAEVTTSSSGASCGLEIPGHGPTLFYARQERDGLTASLCSGTRPAADGPPESLGPGRAPASATPSPTEVAAPPAPDAREDGGAMPYVTAVALVGGLGTLLTRRLRQ